ncbi:hypothetical protein [Brevundimonas sp. CEF1]|uniref:hypothetical protein n=1 Tax=Brevundimonas sp. CEF1 TaxID=3442642 RepID=UPI003F51734F
MRAIRSAYLCFAVSFFSVTAVSAQDFSQPRAPALQSLMECRSIADSGARLNCFDSATASLETAERQGEVVVVERQRLQEARRAIFGFTAPQLPDFITGDRQDQIESIETTLVSATQNNGWTLHLADGSVWKQVDAMPVSFRVKEGTPVRVRRAAMGSYLLAVGRSPAMRVRRQ